MSNIYSHPCIAELYALRHERLCLSCWLTQIEEWLTESLGPFKIQIWIYIYIYMCWYYFQTRYDQILTHPYWGDDRITGAI